MSTSERQRSRGQRERPRCASSESRDGREERDEVRVDAREEPLESVAVGWGGGSDDCGAGLPMTKIEEGFVRRGRDDDDDELECGCWRNALDFWGGSTTSSRSGSQSRPSSACVTVMAEG